MTRGILIAGNESSLFSAVAAEAVKRVESFACALIPNRFPPPEGGIPQQKTEITGGAIPLSWNPSSPISARTLILAAENRLGKINDAILICSPPAVFKTAEALMPEEIEILVNDHVKGWFFLIRELALYFRRLGAGTLSLAVPENSQYSGKEAPGHSVWNKNIQTDLLGSTAAASFRNLAQGILVSSINEPFQVMGFTGSEAGMETEFASWLFKIIDEGAGKNKGRWHKYSKMGFFQRGSARLI